MPTHTLHTVSAVGGLPQCHRERERERHTDRHRETNPHRQTHIDRPTTDRSLFQENLRCLLFSTQLSTDVTRCTRVTSHKSVNTPLPHPLDVDQSPCKYTYPRGKRAQLSSSSPRPMDARRVNDTVCQATRTVMLLGEVS